MPNTVLVVGAGPAGLAASLELARQGWVPQIIDRLPEPTPFSRAIGVNARTLELLHAYGLDQPLLEAGQMLPRLHLRTPRRLVATVDFNRMHHPFHFLLALAQSETERLLGQRLSDDGVSIERGVELLKVEQDPDGVTCTVRVGNQEQRRRVSYLIGADGSHSTVRAAIGAQMIGHSYAQPWTLADIRGHWPFERDAVQLIAQPGRVVLAFPFGQDLIRVVASQGEVLDQLPAGTNVSEVVWTSAFRISERLSSAFSLGRIFLVGDAAHLHSPVGARGMNLGIEDGIVLARKMVGGDLARYATERRPLAAHVIRLTQLQTRLVTLANPLLRTVRDVALPAALAVPPLREQVLREVSGLRSPSRRDKPPIHLNREPV